MKKEFESRAGHFKKTSEQLSRKHSLIAVFRILIFVLSVIFVFYFANERDYVALAVTVFLFPVPFGFLVNYHNKIAYQRNQAKFISQINEEEIVRLDGELKSFDEGVDFFDNGHAYTSDLDVFGKNSLFQLISRATTPSGRNVLAEWFKASAVKEEILDRQNAVKELAPQLEWRQGFQASGMHHNKDKSIEKLTSWLEEENQISKPGFKQSIAIALTVIALGVIVYSIIANITFSFVLLALLTNGIFLGKYLKYSKEVSEKISKISELLASYVSLISLIEASNFQSKKLITLKSSFENEGKTASKEIKKLEKLLDHFDRRANPFYLFYSILLNLDVHRLVQVEQWRINNRENIQKWFESIGQFEVLCSYAAYSYANPDTTFPEISEDRFEFSSKDLGHPLIQSEKRVKNDFEIKGEGTITLITGSNMSGKSTFLRTVGVNMVLASSGATVSAKSVKTSVVQLFTGMRSADDLDEGISSFYAELKRIQQLLKLVEDSEIPVMFMLDEILKGTNSKDRHKGAEALVRQLSKTQSFGFVSTHDLELAKLAKELDTVKNKSFNSSIKDDEIIFDYKITEGACHSFNASELMKKIGIKIQ
ncbi:MAG: DNA mismatch repair protein MutS [Bacteroidota bacterium]